MLLINFMFLEDRHRRKMTRLMLWRKSFFYMYLVPKTWAADGRIRKNLQFKSLLQRKFFLCWSKFDYENTQDTLFPPSLLLLFHALTFLYAFGVSDAQEKEIKLRSEHTTQLQTCHNTILRCHVVSWHGFCAKSHNVTLTLGIPAR